MTVESEKEFDVLHTINRLYLETFQGSYQLLEESGERMIIITYPVSWLQMIRIRHEKA